MFESLTLSGSKKAAECDLDGSMTAFYVFNGGNSEKRQGISNTKKTITATL